MLPLMTSGVSCGLLGAGVGSTAGVSVGARTGTLVGGGDGLSVGRGVGRSDGRAVGGGVDGAGVSDGDGEGDFVGTIWAWLVTTRRALPRPTASVAAPSAEATSADKAAHSPSPRPLPPSPPGALPGEGRRPWSSRTAVTVAVSGFVGGGLGARVGTGVGGFEGAGTGGREGQSRSSQQESHASVLGHRPRSAVQPPSAGPFAQTNGAISTMQVLHLWTNRKTAVEAGREGA